FRDQGREGRFPRIASGQRRQARSGAECAALYRQGCGWETVRFDLPGDRCLAQDKRPVETHSYACLGSSRYEDGQGGHGFEDVSKATRSIFTRLESSVLKPRRNDGREKI